MRKREKDGIEEGVEKYNTIITNKTKLLDEIEEHKRTIKNLEMQCVQLDSNLKETEAELQAELYSSYREKDLLKMIPKVEKLSNKEVTNDFKGLVSKFAGHTLKTNDISQLHTYCKLYGTYVKEENSIVKGLFKALGGELDD